MKSQFFCTFNVLIVRNSILDEYVFECNLSSVIKAGLIQIQREHTNRSGF